VAGSKATSAVTISGSDLASAFRQVLPAVGADPKRPALHGVLVEVASGVGRVAASDAHRLVVRELACDSTSDLRALVPGDEVRDLVDWLDQPDRVGISMEQSSLVLAVADGRRSLPVMAEEFPAVDPFLVARPGAHRIDVSRQELLDVLDRLPDAPFARLRLRSGGLLIDAEGQSESIAGACVADGIEITLNPELLLDAAVAFTGAEVVIEVTSPTQPIVLTSPTGEPLTYLIMPIRTR
jgi:DNA polymerase III sliding clamp (beta) subunit (PCNA family)